MISIQVFKTEVLGWAKEIEVKPKEIHLRDMSRKWASCSSKGRLTFSFLLLNEPVEVRSKVIVHELLHLKYPNHGKMFKSLFLSYLNKKGIPCSINDAFSIK
jgi:predicted metal-dependent hydrolase